MYHLCQPPNPESPLNGLYAAFPSSRTMPHWDNYHNREVITLVYDPYHPCLYRTLIC